MTDDQGWRIEIKGYPKLTEVGSIRNQTLVGHASEKPESYKEVERAWFLYPETDQGNCKVCSRKIY